LTFGIIILQKCVWQIQTTIVFTFSVANETIIVLNPYHHPPSLPVSPCLVLVYSAEVCNPGGEGDWLSLVCREGLPLGVVSNVKMFN
jgi:hypothetical protein